MTCIAYCNGIMACDSAYTANGIQEASMTKIVRLSSGALLGGSGDSDDRDVVALLDKIQKPEKLPSRKDLADLNIDYLGLLVFPSGRVFKIEIAPGDKDRPASAAVWECNRGVYAVGSGGEIALGNMDATADAVAAVKAACKWNTSDCRLPVHAVALREGRKSERRKATNRTRRKN